MARRAYTDDEKAEALRLYETDGPSKASKALGIPKGTIGRWAKAAGVGTVPSEKTRAATEAAQIDAAAVRAATASKSIKAADAIADLILERLPAEGGLIALKDLATIQGILVDKHVVLIRADQGNDEHTAVDAWLTHVMGGA